MSENSEKSINLTGIQFKLRNGRLYAIGNGYLSSTRSSEKILLSCDKEIEIDLCVKDIKYNEEHKILSLYDTRDQGYDIFIHDSLFYKGVSYVQSNSGKIMIGSILGSAVLTYVLCKLLL